VISPKVWTRGLLILLVVGCALLAFAGLKGLYDRLPWSDTSRRERAEASRDIAQSEGVSAKLEAQGNADQLDRLEDYHAKAGRAHDLTRAAQEQARSAPDASTPLDPDRAARLRDADDGLCRLSPGLCAPPAPGHP
jgi:hypothetical protein